MKVSATIVVDTNVLINAALLPNSVTARALGLAFDQFVLAQNPLTWAELQKKGILPKFDKYFGLDSRLRFMANLTRNITFFEVQSTAVECRDPDDNKFLALAVDAGAGFLISGDKDLLVLQAYQGVRVCTPAEFLAINHGERM